MSGAPEVRPPARMNRKQYAGQNNNMTIGLRLALPHL
jgi:hypothetical protein